MALSRGQTLRMALRAHLLQVLLNRRRMQGAGYLFILWPFLLRTKANRARILAAADYLNAHPVFACFAAGALRRRIENGDVEREGTAFREWQSSLCGPLGLLGDMLIWDRWKPLVFAIGILLLLWMPSIAAWAGVAVALVLAYNIPLFALRWWGIREGYRLGARVLDALGHPAFSSVRRALTLCGVIVAGLLLASAILRSTAVNMAESLLPLLQFGIGFAVILTATRMRIAITWGLLLAIGIAVVTGAVV